MAYLPQTEEEVRAMLAAIGVPQVEALFATIPPDVRLGRALEIPPALSELELTRHLEASAARNLGTHQAVCFLGGGAYDHFIPAVVDFVAARSEFYTSYTPYQPEVSQGNLQALFEYQTLITQLTAMDVSNASMYDGATALAEAVLMALSTQNGRRRIVLPENVHPEYRAVVKTYLTHLGIETVTLPTPQGIVEPEQLAEVLDSETACVVIQQPNFFGCVESAGKLTQVAHEKGCLVIVVIDPISLALLRRPGDYGADIVVAEGQPLGIPLAWGGPYLGILACREAFLRRLPGRLVGQTTDHHGNRCWVLTLQTREQHIRREKATSNICTNQGLMALRATVYLAAMGPRGLRRVAESCVHKSHYLHRRLCEEGLTPRFSAPFFKEFVVALSGPGEVDGLLEAALHPEGSNGKAISPHARLAPKMFAGLPLGRWYPQHTDALLIAVTEKRTREEMDHLVGLMKKYCQEG